MKLVSFPDFIEMYGENRVQNWMSRNMGNVLFKPSSVLLTDHHLHFYAVCPDWRHEQIKKQVGTNPGVDFIPPAIYFEDENEAMLWLLTWG
jgi:hypothetical protein